MSAADNAAGTGPRCKNCGAPLEAKQLSGPIAQCHYCGAHHSVRRAGADEAPEVARDELIGRHVSPYLFAPVIGASAVLAFRELLWSPYDAWPIRVLAIVFIVIGILGMRVPATLGLALVGVCSIVKPFVFPPIGHGHAYSPTSEMGLHYLGPGLVTLTVAGFFLASFAKDEWRPALRALKVRVPVLALALAGAAGAHFFVGQTWRALAEESKGQLAELQELASAACSGELPVDMQASLASHPTHHRTHPAGLVPNTLVLECIAEKDKEEEQFFVPRHDTPDPVRHLAFFQAARDSPNSFYSRGADELTQVMYKTLESYEYLVIYNTSEVLLVDRKARAVQRRFALVMSKPSTEWDDLLSELGEMPLDARRE